MSEWWANDPPEKEWWANDPVAEPSFAQKFGRGLREGSKQIVGGALEAAQSVVSLAEKPARFLESKVPLGSVTFGPEGIGHTKEFKPLQVPQIEEPTTTGPAVSRGIAQFLTGFLPAMRAVRSFGPARPGFVRTAAEAELAAQTAEQAVFSPYEERLSNLVQKFPALQNPVTEFLQADPDDTEAEARFKMALEGLGVGLAVTPFAEALKRIRIGRVAKKAPEQAVQRPPETAPEPRPPEYAGNINLSRIDSEESAKDVIRETADRFASQLEEARRGVMSEGDTRALADTLGMTYDDLLGRRKGEAFNAETALAARNLLVDSSEEVVRLAKEAVGGSDEALAALEQARLRHLAIQEQVAGVTAEAGRALRSFQYLSRSQDKARALKEILAQRGGRENVEEFAQLASTLETPEQVSKFLRDSAQATTAQKLVEVWKAALLSSPRTHAVNILSNELVSLWTMPENLLAATFGAFRRGDKVYYRDVGARMYGWVEGHRDGLKMAAKVFRTGEPSDIFTKTELPHGRAVGGKLGEVTRLPFRFLEAEDEFFKTVGFRQELHSLAMRDGLDKGLRGRELAEHIQSILDNPPDKILNAAIDTARYQTFTKPLGSLGTKVQAIARDHPSANIIFPFIRTPTNIIKFAGERSPFAPFFREYKDAVAKGGAAADLARARMVMGSGVGATVATLAAEGHITGGGPTDPRLRAALFNTGWKPYSIRIGNDYYAYNRLEPLGILFGVAADFAEIAGQIEEAEASEIASAVAFSISKNLTSKTWLEGVSSMIEAVGDPDRYGERYIQRLTGTVVPTGVAHIAQTQDPIMRDVRSSLDAIKSRLPGYSETLPARRNIWGEPILLGGGLGPDLISPIYTSTNKEDKVADEVVRLKIGLAMPTRKIGGIELTPEQYSEYVELAGVPAKQMLDRLVASPQWARIPDVQKEEMIRKTVSSFRDMARKQMMLKYQKEILLPSTRKRIEELGGR